MKVKKEKEWMDYTRIAMERQKHKAKAKAEKQAEYAAPPCKVEDGKLSALSGGLVALARLDDGKNHTFIRQGDGLKWVDIRSVNGIQTAKDGSRYGYVSLQCDRVRVDLVTVETLHGVHVVAIVPEAKTRHFAPLPLDTQADLAEWAARGVDGRTSPITLARLMSWRGNGAREAAKQLIARRNALARRETPPECPLVIFPPREDTPAQVSAMERMEKMLESLGKSNRDLAAEVETLKRWRKSDLEAIRTLSREIGKLRDLLLSGFNP